MSFIRRVHYQRLHCTCTIIVHVHVHVISNIHSMNILHSVHLSVVNLALNQSVKIILSYTRETPPAVGHFELLHN